MYSIVQTAILRGMESVPVKVEADVSGGMPLFEMIGFLSAEVKEAKERVRTALKNAGYLLPAKRITVNLSPADIKKSGSGFDLPIAAALLCALGFLTEAAVKDTLIIGEVGLNGQIKAVRGVLPIVEGAVAAGLKQCIVPALNASEAGLIKGIKVLAFSHIKEMINCLNTGKYEEKRTYNIEETRFQKPVPDFSQINGQLLSRRACEVAVSGMHNFLMVGPPGSGKSMIAERIPGILPPMDEAERMELLKIYSICGLLFKQGVSFQHRPFRAPHHTVTPQGLAGGGRLPRPGEISLAHRGVLFLDELTEFKKSTLDILRQPMEEGQVRLVREQGTYCFPAEFMLTAAMNPCSCGYYPDRNKCQCSRASIDRYLNRISKPLLDRIDICIEVVKPEYRELAGNGKNESSAEIRKRVIAAQRIQHQRFRKSGIRYNSKMPPELVSIYCKLDAKQERYMEEIYEKLELSARACHKILKVARTIADLDGSGRILQKHLNEAVCYRSLDKKIWEH